MNEEVKNGYATRALVFGILALALCEGVIPGIIFGILSQKQAKAFTDANNGVLCGKAKVGRILGKVGLILSIVSAVCYVIIAVSGAAAYSSGAFHF